MLKDEYNRSETVNLSNRRGHYLTKNLQTQTKYTQLPKLLTFILMTHHNLWLFKMFTISLPASYVFRIFHRGTVCSLWGDQSSHFRWSWIYILHGGESLLFWFAIHFQSIWSNCTKYYNISILCLGKRERERKKNITKTTGKEYGLMKIWNMYFSICSGCKC